MPCLRTLQWSMRWWRRCMRRRCGLQRWVWMSCSHLQRIIYHKRYRCLVLVSLHLPDRLYSSLRHVDTELQGKANFSFASGCKQRTHRVSGRAAVPWSRGERRPRWQHGSPWRLSRRSFSLCPAAALSRSRSWRISSRWQRSSSPLHLCTVSPVSGKAAWGLASLATIF